MMNTKPEVAEIEVTINKKVRELLNITEDIGPEDNLNQWGMDSIKVIQLIVELEEMFDIIYEDNELLFENFSNVQQITDRILTKVVTPG